MTKLIERTGDIFTTDAGGIGHGCNVRGKMGAGIATQFRDRWPGMYEQYRYLCRDVAEADRLKPGEIFPWFDPDSGLWIYNIASQREPGRDARIGWLRSGVAAALSFASVHNVETVALPRIGCGIGGLCWDDVLAELAKMAEAGPVDVEAWTFR